MGQLVLAAGARQINVVIAGSVDKRHPFGGGIDHGKDVHIAAGLFSQFAAVIHAAQVDHKGLLGDLVGLGAGDKAGGHVVQCAQALLRPDTAQRQKGTQEHREHPGYLAGGAVLLAALDQQPEQHQQRRNDDQI